MKELEYNKFYISGFQIRRIWSQGEWWYSVTDVVAYLTKSKNPVMYMQQRMSRDGILKSTISPYVKKFLMRTGKGNFIVKCINLYGLWYITHSLPKKYRWRVKVFRSWIE